MAVSPLSSRVHDSHAARPHPGVDCAVGQSGGADRQLHVLHARRRQPKVRDHAQDARRGVLAALGAAATGDAAAVPAAVPAAPPHSRRLPGWQFNSFKKGPEKRPEKGSESQFVASICMNSEKGSSLILFRALFYYGDLIPDSIGQKVHPKRGPKKGPEIFRPFFNAIDMTPCIS